MGRFQPRKVSQRLALRLCSVQSRLFLVFNCPLHRQRGAALTEWLTAKLQADEYLLSDLQFDPPASASSSSSSAAAEALHSSQTVSFAATAPAPALNASAGKAKLGSSASARKLPAGKATPSKTTPVRLQIALRACSRVPQLALAVSPLLLVLNLLLQTAAHVARLLLQLKGGKLSTPLKRSTGSLKGTNSSKGSSSSSNKGRPSSVSRSSSSSSLKGRSSASKTVERKSSAAADKKAAAKAAAALNAESNSADAKAADNLSNSQQLAQSQQPPSQSEQTERKQLRWKRLGIVVVDFQSGQPKVLRNFALKHADGRQARSPLFCVLLAVFWLPSLLVLYMQAVAALQLQWLNSFLVPDFSLLLCVL